MAFSAFSPNHFNPRPPCGGRLADFQQREARQSHFNPRPPCGGRHRRIYLRKDESIFQSTPSVWRATATIGTLIATVFDFNPRPPCGGRHIGENMHIWEKQTFQSTPSVWRATSFWRRRLVSAAKFQSTPSVWRATGISSADRFGIRISIHALRVEGDP